MKRYTILLITFLIMFSLIACMPINVTHPETKIIQPELVQENIYTFADGETVDIYAHSGKDKLYRLANGAVILTESKGFHDIFNYEDENYSFSEDDIFLQLDENVQKNILTHYHNLGKLYNLETELENAYAIYQRRVNEGITYWTGESDEDGVVHFRGPSITQRTFLTGYNDTFICFDTELYKPLPITLQPYKEDYEVYQNVEDLSGGYGFATIFDVKTGEIINQYDMFTIPADKIGEVLLSIPDYLSDEEREIMIKALKPEYLFFDKEYLFISFPHESIDNIGHTIPLKYSEISLILQPWAVPKR